MAGKIRTRSQDTFTDSDLKAMHDARQAFVDVMNIPFTPIELKDAKGNVIDRACPEGRLARYWQKRDDLLKHFDEAVLNDQREKLEDEYMLAIMNLNIAWRNYVAETTQRGWQVNITAADRKVCGCGYCRHRTPEDRIKGARFLILRTVWRMASTGTTAEAKKELTLRVQYYEWLAQRHNIDTSFESFIGKVESLT